MLYAPDERTIWACLLHLINKYCCCGRQPSKHISQIIWCCKYNRGYPDSVLSRAFKLRFQPRNHQGQVQPMQVVRIHDKHIARQLSSAASQCYVCWDDGASTENALKETRLQSASRSALHICTTVADRSHMDNYVAVLCHTNSLVSKKCGCCLPRQSA